MEGTVVCPVCTLYLRPGMTLKSHLASHPKQKVIEALVKLHDSPEPERTCNAQPAQYSRSSSSDTSFNNNHNFLNNGSKVQQSHQPLAGNHAFIYQQFVTTDNPSGYINSMNQQNQFITIPVFNQQMMGGGGCPPGMMYPPPYMYQQQQIIMSSGMSSPTSRFLPIEEAQISEIKDDEDTNLKDPLVDETKSCVEEGEKHDVIPDNVVDTIDLEDEAKSSTNDHPPPLLSNQETCEVDDKDDKDESTVASVSEFDVEHQHQHQISKSCQTLGGQQTPSTIVEINDDEEPPRLHPEVIIPDVEDADSKKSFDDIECTPTYLTLTNHLVDPEKLSPHIILDVSPNGSTQQNAQQQNNGAFDVDGMNLILGHEFMSAPVISAVEDFDYINRDRPRDLMNIGDTFHDNRDENISIDSTHIRADEHMPPRGELSGQESNASDIAWPQMHHYHHHEGSSGMSTSYDLLARESWDSSEGSDLDADEPPPYQSRDPFQQEDDDMPTVSGYSAPPITYKCNSCEETFVCPKERRVHQSRVHDGDPLCGAGVGKDNKQNVIGSQLFKKNVKKLVIKPKVLTKTENSKSENPFDQIFSNIMKLEDGNATLENATITTNANVSLDVEVEETKVPIISTAPQVIICVLCCRLVTDGQTLREHNMAVHGFTADMKYKCATCDETFNYEPKYIEHLVSHPLGCQFCGKFFYRMHNMQLHIKRHLGIRQYMCSVCDKSFLTKQKLQEHNNIHTGLSPLKCNFCEETFKRHSNLVQHRNRHHLHVKKKIKDYICFCGEVFHSKKKLAWHKEIHENKPKSCSHCSEKFVHLSSLTRHVRKAHNERFVPGTNRDRENVECPICKGVYLRSSLDQHIKNHSGTKNFTCSICDKDFSTKWNLKLHKWTHAARNAKPFKCEHCKGAFVRESDYVAHMNSHKQIRPYTCNYCGAKFIRKYNCQRHVKEHERGKTFTCTVCSKTFHRSYYLHDHMRIHSGLRPHSCHICGKTSTTKSNHNKHIKIHHAREPVTTEN